MIFVTLGTQDKKFPRLLQALDKAIEKGEIEEKVIVQAGNTKYESENMDIFDLISPYEFNKYIDDCDILITHGGVGSIITAVKKGKKVIAAARLQKYKEHVNDHQKQIIKEFEKEGYLLELKDFNQIGKTLNKAKKFKPKKFKSNTENMINLLDNLIEDFLQMEKPTKEIIREFIEKIEIHSDKQVDIYFNFKPLQELNNNFSVAKKVYEKKVG